MDVIFEFPHELACQVKDCLRYGAWFLARSRLADSYLRPRKAEELGQPYPAERESDSVYHRIFMDRIGGALPTQISKADYRRAQRAISRAKCDSLHLDLRDAIRNGMDFNDPIPQGPLTKRLSDGERAMIEHWQRVHNLPTDEGEFLVLSEKEIEEREADAEEGMRVETESAEGV